MTYANPYGQWARGGQGQSVEDKAVLAWMHTNKRGDSDGWYLASFDHPDGGRSHTAASGLRADQLLAGGHNKLPALEKMLDTYKPRAVVLLIGTNDVSAGRKVEAYREDVAKALDLMLARGIVPLLTTIPPHPGNPELAKAYNMALRELAKSKSVPLIDFEKAILERRLEDWNGTLLSKNDVHPTASQGGATASSAPTPENLKNSGYLLRGWLTVQKIAEVKKAVFDGM
jgi:lysophospholipase L1-like esterase